MQTMRRIDQFLQPGEYALGRSGHMFTTVLGSCVSITLWNRERRVGAISHFVVPTRGVPARILDARYGDEALLLMLRGLDRLGIPREECEAKIFGGAKMFYSETRANAMSVGERNGETARSLLRLYGIRTVSEDLFGLGHRKVVFDVHSGDVWSRQVRPDDPDWQGVR
jgi:chemotaxis protein CheD